MSYKVSYTMAPLRPLEIFSHATALRRLQLLGWQPSTIYDVGAYQGQWSKDAVRIFPAAELLLFEANADNEAQLKLSGYRYFIVALAAEDGVERTFFTQKQAIAIGASLYRENTIVYRDENLIIRKAVAARLDSIVATQKLNHADIIKIDVQGAELDVLAGAEDAMKNCDALILETSLLNYNRGAPMFGDVVAAINQLDLKCVDICEVHRIGAGFIFQIDLLFVRDALYRKYHSAAGLL
jgi:FkbM family methyltransferase